MYPKFIELHGDVTDQALSANVEHIVMFSDGVIVLSNEPMSKEGKAFHVTETYDELKTLIRDCGCLIHKADPRLDTEHPLTMYDLKDMLGEPVWNSNTGKWALVRNYIEVPEPDGVDVSFLLDAADNSTGMAAGDLIKTPLYRMKVTK